MSNAKDACTSSEEADPATQLSFSIPQPVTKTISSEDVDDDDNDDDDDWFNKSLDDFDIPRSIAKDDCWSGEDEDEEDDAQHSCQGSAFKASGRKIESSGNKSPPNAKTLASADKDANEPSRTTDPGIAANHGARDDDRHQQPTEDKDLAASDESDDEDALLQDVGVMLFLPPEGTSNRFQLLLANETQKPPPENDQACEGEGRSQGINTGTAETPSAGGGEERQSSGDGGRLTQETGVIIRSYKLKRPKGESSGGQLGPQEQDRGDEASREGGEQDNPELSRSEPEEKNEEINRRTEEEEEEEYTVIRAKVFPVDELDENWFQEQLNELPTLFNQRSVCGLSEARLRSNLQLMLEGKQAESNDDENSNVKTSIPAGYDHCGAAPNPTLVELLKTGKGDYDVVQTQKLQQIRDLETQTRYLWPKRILFCVRSRFPANCAVVLKWLLGNRQEAEREARHLVRQHPCSFVSVANLFYILWRKGERKEAVELLLLFTLLKERTPDIYQTIMSEDQGELSLCYTELGPEFIPKALTIMEAFVLKKPHWDSMKWNWALNLRRLTNATHTWMKHLNDKVTPLLKATELLIELLQNSKTSALVAAELGDILNSCEFDEKLKSTVGRKALEAGYTSAKCFDMVMQAKDTLAGGSTMIRAGKYFRYMGQLHKSEKALKQAVAVQDSAKANHQLALTLKKLATEERRRAFQNSKNQRQGKRPAVSQVGPRRGASRQHLGVISRARLFARDSNMASMERSMKAIVYQTFSREDQYVKETMHHLNRAVMLSYGENCAASYDLGLMYKALGEYRDALEQFLLIAEIDKEPAAVVNAFEQSGLVTLEKCSLEENESRARAMLEDGRSMLTMAILVQSRLVQQFRGTDTAHAVWRSCYSLGQYLQLQQDIEGVFEEDSPVEVWLLRLLRVYADTLPVLTSLQQFTQHDVQSPEVVKGKLHKYLRDQRHEDAILFSHLLHLTEQGNDMKTDDLSLCLRTLVLGARAKLMTDIKAGLVGNTFNMNMARKFFRWAFEDVYVNVITDSVKDTKNPPVCADHVSLPASPKAESQQRFSSAETVAQSQSEILARTTITENGHETSSRELSASLQVTRIRDSADATRPKQNASRESHETPATGSREHTTKKESGRPSIVVSQTVKQPQTGRAGQSDWAEDMDEEDDQFLDYHVLLVHDPQDQEAARMAQELQCVLQKTCGLRTYLPESGSVDFMAKTTLEAMDSAYHLLFVIGSREMSPELENYIQHATARYPEGSGPSVDVRRTSLRALSSVTFRGATASLQPKLLQSRPMFAVQDSSGFSSHGGLGSVAWVDSVCTLFCFLIGLDLKF